MNLLFISECEKNALIETRRTLDQFAERKGSRTWQTQMTYEGMTTVRSLLRRTARKNTAVSCHWIKKANESELLWIIGDQSRFDDEGRVPTNYTHRNILKKQRQSEWHAVEDIALATGIAGLFHDFGKANQLFQQKLKKSKISAEPLRHEWISSRIFEAFACRYQSDEEWLQVLAKISPSTIQKFTDEYSLKKDLIQDKISSPFKFLKDKPFAEFIAWLILSHHRLPCPPNSQSIDTSWFPTLINEVTNRWNSDLSSVDRETVLSNWNFDNALPWLSEKWCQSAHTFANRALKRLSQIQKAWMHDRVSLHLARMSLMMADHSYSSQEASHYFKNSQYKIYANTDRKTKLLKQKLDEHCIGVAQDAFTFSRRLISELDKLPKLSRHKGITAPSTNSKYRWQDVAFTKVTTMRENAYNQGFFGINLASTGKGKTFGNLKIMYALANPKIGCRVSIGLGLRVLTLQTGKALQERLKLDDDELAVVIGNPAVKSLFDEVKNDEITTYDETGSASTEELLETTQHILHDQSVTLGSFLDRYLKDPKYKGFLGAPILVATLDQLIRATENKKGGKQILPMLRLLSSDVILDEPDDLNISSFHALCRIVNFTAMLGRNVLISSATIPPSLAEGLFDAYLNGRKKYQDVHGQPGKPLIPFVGWFDEFSTVINEVPDQASFKEKHINYVKNRSIKLKQESPKRIASIINIDGHSDASDAQFAKTLNNSISKLHIDNHIRLDNKFISLGLIRMSNIDSLVAVGKEILKLPPPDNHRYLFCFYHSQFPLAQRAFIERKLDLLLYRANENYLEYVKKLTDKHPETNISIIVMATPVAEVGRDHDYDWAIIEPSSIRSLIQCAGRVGRHRDSITPTTSNIHVLNLNYRALKNPNGLSYYQPGFESSTISLGKKAFEEIIEQDFLKNISSILRIEEPDALSKYFGTEVTPLQVNSLRILEHLQMRREIFGGIGNQIPAKLWWEQDLTWSHYLQDKNPFREMERKTDFCFYLEEDEDECKIHEFRDHSDPYIVHDMKFNIVNTPCVYDRISIFSDCDIGVELIKLSQSMEQPLDWISKRFGTFSLRENKDKKWNYSRVFGFYGSK